MRLHTDTRLSLDEARLLPRVRASEQPFTDRCRMERAQAAALADGLASSPDAQMPKRTTFVPSPGDLRGFPVTGHGGASPGTNPESSIERLDRERERRAKTQLPMVAFV